jgi:hypothetical protein
MKKFEVIRSTIKDSVGQYCVPGDKAILDKTTAEGYLKANFIRVELPDFDEPEDDTKDESDTSDENGADTSERTEAASTPRQRTTKSRARLTANG